jgi:hypothetical protein
MAGWHDASQDFMARSMGVNHRTSKREGLPVWIMGDYDNVYGLAAPWGYVDSACMTIGTGVVLGDIVAFDSNNYLHLTDGVIVPWCGIAPV